MIKAKLDRGHKSTAEALRLMTLNWERELRRGETAVGMLREMLANGAGGRTAHPPYIAVCHYCSSSAGHFSTCLFARAKQFVARHGAKA